MHRWRFGAAAGVASMAAELSAFHFLRPAWLLLVPLACLLPLWPTCLQRPFRDVPIAPALLPYLIVPGETPRGLRPLHQLALLLGLGAVACAGPTWEQAWVEGLDERTPLIVAVDLSATMAVGDVSPSRLQAVQHKLLSLVDRQAGRPVGLLAYAGSAHLVLPPTRDRVLLVDFLQALDVDLIAAPGKNALAALQLAQRLAERSEAPATLLLATDGADTSQLPQIRQCLAHSPLHTVLFAVGAQPGSTALARLAEAVNATMVGLTLDDQDLQRIEREVQARDVDVGDPRQRWRDAGYWLCWPLLVLALLAIRKGWSPLGLTVLALGLALPSGPARAGALADAFISHDQQGWLAVSSGRYAEGAALFDDPYWKGRAAYLAADYPLALNSFARLDTAESWFYLGNTFMRLSRYDDAAGAFRQALRRQPQMTPASANLALAMLLGQETETNPDAAAQVEPGEIQQRPTGGKALEQAQVAADETWLRNLDLSPRAFLKRKFAVEAARVMRPEQAAQ